MEHALLQREERFMAIDGGKSYTVAYIEALPESERVELIDGELFKMEAPTLTHQDLLGWLNMKIRMYITENKGRCKVLPAPFGVYVKDDVHNFVEPDISVICDRDKLDDKGCHGAPDWIIEIISPSSKYMDRVRKLTLYREAGVREYWIADPKKDAITVYDLEHGKEPVVYSFSDRVKAGIYEDFFIDFSEMDV